MASIISPPLELVILAAGCSSRLGQAKQLVKLNGTSLLARQCQIAKNVNENVSCVVGFESQRMIKELANLSVTEIENEHWQQGLASSIAKAVTSLKPEIEAVMLILVDQWQLTEIDLTQLIKIWQEDPSRIVTASKNAAFNNEQYAQGSADISGPPVIFPRQYFRELSQLTSGQGAKSLIKKHKQNTVNVSLPHAFIDLDTPEQLIVLQNYSQAN